MFLRSSLLSLGLIAYLVQPASAFLEDILRQMGGGGGQFHFGGGGSGGHQRSIWPKGLSGEIGENYNWLKGTTWEWNSWRNVQFEADGNFNAPTQECSQKQCKWCTHKDKVYVMWGRSGIHILKAKNSTPESGNYLYGKRKMDGEKIRATFVSKEDSDEEMDPYEVLGLDFDATDRQIKKAFRKLSIKYHPDKCKEDKELCAKMFERARIANSLLSDPDKRILFDTGGMEAVEAHETSEQRREGGHMDPLAAFFGGGRQQRQSNKGDDSRMQVTVELGDLYNGQTMQVKLSRRIVCRGCRKRDTEKCRSCGKCPPELKMVQRNMGNGMIVQQQMRVESKEKCKNEETALDLVIEKGMADGESLKFERMGQQSPGEIPGDVIFLIKEGTHDVFTRDGNNLRMKLKLSLKEALLGFKKDIPHMDEHSFVISSSNISRPGQIIKVAGEGMPVHNFPSQKGDLFAEVEVLFPTSLTAAQKTQIEELFA